MRFLLHVIIALVGFVVPACGAMAQPLLPMPELEQDGRVDIGKYARLVEDAQSNLTVETVRQRFESGQVTPPPATGLNLGYTASSWWFGFRLPGGGADKAAIGRVIEVGFPTLDHIDFYLPNATQPITVGDRQPFADRPIRHRNFVFELPANTPEGSLVLMRVRSEGTLSAPLTLWTPAAWSEYSRYSYAGLSIYFGALLALLIYNALLWVSIRDRMYLDYVLFVSGLAVGLAGFNGLGVEFIWSGWPWFANVAFPLGFSLCSFGVAQFTRSFLSPETVSVRLDRVLLGCALLSALAAVITVGFSYTIGGKVLTIATVFTTTMAIIAGLYCQRKRVSSAPLFLLAWTLFMLFGIAFALRNYGLVPSNFLTLHGLQFGSLIGMLLLSFALANRFHSERRAKEAAQAEMMAAKQAHIDALKRSEQELELRVTERTAELATANAKLAASESQQRELAQHDGLTGLANRTLLGDRLDQAVALSHREKRRFALLYLDLDKFKPVNDLYGHATGDALLKLVAQRISERVRHSDTVARVGGDEFIVILHAVESDNALMAVANGIRDALNLAFHVEGHTIGIGCSIGVAVYPDHAGDAPTLSRLADEAMYQAKQAGRSRVQLCTPKRSN
jgi:diguanylate cyclase (GGDEF)-like protein